MISAVNGCWLLFCHVCKYVTQQRTGVCERTAGVRLLCLMLQEFERRSRMETTTETTVPAPTAPPADRQSPLRVDSLTNQRSTWTSHRASPTGRFYRRHHGRLSLFLMLLFCCSLTSPDGTENESRRDGWEQFKAVKSVRKTSNGSRSAGKGLL